MSMSPVKQAVRLPDASRRADRLLKSTRPSLACWYADPRDTQAAQALLEVTQRRLQIRQCRVGQCFPLYVLRLICHYWLDRDCALEYEQISMLAGDDRDLALLKLVYGQLLISRKCRLALQHLARGFSLAARHLAAPDYFHLLRQHELLGYLPLSGTPSSPQNLLSLLNEAAVIKRLRASDRRHCGNAHYDTLG